MVIAKLIAIAVGVLMIFGGIGGLIFKEGAKNKIQGLISIIAGLIIAIVVPIVIG